MAYVVTNHLKYEHFEDLEGAINFLKSHDESYKILKEDAFGNLMPVSQSELIHANASQKPPVETVPWPKDVYSPQRQQPQNLGMQNQMPNLAKSSNFQQQQQQPQNTQSQTVPQVMPYIPYPIMQNQSHSGGSAFIKFIITILMVIVVLLAFGFGFSYLMNMIVKFFTPS